MVDTTEVTRHYMQSDIAGRIITALRAELGADVAITPDALAPIDHFHGRGLAATRELVALLQPQKGEHILDIGCGIGGPARWIAAHFGCRVSGIDLTHEFIEAAKALIAATGQGAQVDVQNASALAIPFADGTFDRVYSQNVIMNIADKDRFYGEAIRVLKPGGVAAFSNLGAGPGGAPYYPVPWAQSAATSFLETPVETQQHLTNAGFEIISFEETTARVLAAQAAFIKKIEAEGMPRLGVHSFMGTRFLNYQRNSGRSMREGRLSVIEALVRKAA